MTTMYYCLQTTFFFSLSLSLSSNEPASPTTLLRQHPPTHEPPDPLALCGCKALKSVQGSGAASAGASGISYFEELAAQQRR